MIQTTSKSGYINDQIFSDIKEILIDIKIFSNKIPNNIMVDFEKPLIKSYKSIISKFENTIFSLCKNCYGIKQKALIYVKKKKFKTLQF
jgi:hypothetical protein